LTSHDLLAQILNVNSQIQQASGIDNTNLWITIGTIAVAIATIILVIVTGYYAIQTRNIVKAQMKSVDAIKESTQAQFRPYIQIEMDFRTANIPLIRVFNAGKGTAKSIELLYKIKEIENSEKEHKIKVIFPGHSKNLYIEFEGYQKNRDIQWYKDNQTTLEIEWNCEDILKNKFHDSYEIDISSLIRQRQNEYGG
jgi:hypothetical protein